MPPTTAEPSAEKKLRVSTRHQLHKPCGFWPGPVGKTPPELCPWDLTATYAVKIALIALCFCFLTGPAKNLLFPPKKTIILYLNGYNQQNKMEIFGAILNDSQ